MTTPSAPLAELLQALAPPLEYLAADDFRRLEQTRLPLPVLAERLRRARADVSSSVAAPLAELEQILEELQRGLREPLLRRAHALLPILREAAAAAPVESAWRDYRASEGAVDGGLAALAQPARVLRAVGPKRAEDLARFGLHTVEDVLYHLPFRYEDRRSLRRLTELAVGEEATAIGVVSRVREAQAGRRGRRVLEVLLRDDEGQLLLVWFHQIVYFARRLREGQRLLVHGRVEPPLGAGPRRIIHPEIEPLADDETPGGHPRIVPVYE